MPWSARFFDPVILPDGRKLQTLRDAATYITKLLKAEHDADEWQTAMETLLLVAVVGGTVRPSQDARRNYRLQFSKRAFFLLPL